MCPLQDKPGFDSIGEAFIQSGNFGDDDKNASNKTIIKEANRILILSVLKNYGLKLDEFNKKCPCPFLFHKNGLERSGSFYYYKDTNSFYCFGCKHGGAPSDFVSLMEDISKQEAAERLLERFVADPNVVLVEHDSAFFERNKKFMEFSNCIRNFIFDNLDDKTAFEYAEKVCLIFDTINFKHNLDNSGLTSLITKLQLKLGQYKCR